MWDAQNKSESGNDKADAKDDATDSFAVRHTLSIRGIEDSVYMIGRLMRTQKFPPPAKVSPQTSQPCCPKGFRATSSSRASHQTVLYCHSVMPQYKGCLNEA